MTLFSADEGCDISDSDMPLIFKYWDAGGGDSIYILFGYKNKIKLLSWINTRIN